MCTVGKSSTSKEIFCAIQSSRQVSRRASLPALHDAGVEDESHWPHPAQQDAVEPSVQGQSYPPAGMQFVDRCIAQFAFLSKQKRISFSSFITSKNVFIFPAFMCAAQHSTAFKTVKHRPATAPTHPTTYKRTHIHRLTWNMGCAPGARDLEVAGLHFCSAVITSATCFATSCAEVRTGICMHQG